jgi:methionine-rich copper-binding protein CopC
VAFLALAGAATAWAHAEPARSEPAADSRVPRAPERVSVWFSQELFRRTGANTLAVFAADETRVDDREPVIDAQDRTLMSVGLRAPLEPGTYRVEWTSLSALDGDTAAGMFSFTVDPGAPEPAPPPAAPAAVTEESEPSALSGGGTSYWWLAIAVVAAALSVLLGARAIRAPFEGAGT